MTCEEKSMALKLRAQGNSFSAIAEQLGLSVNTVKSFCTRNKGVQVCNFCGKKIQQPHGVRYKKFCSDKCRMNWWKTHSGDLKRKAMYYFCCKCCGKEFQAYGNSHRIYCSRNCYIQTRFGGKKNGFSKRTDVSEYDGHSKENV